MTLRLLQDCDNDVFIPRLQWAKDNEVISDAILTATLGSQKTGECGTITDVTGTTTAHVVSTVDTGKLSNGDQVLIIQVVGTKEINGVATVANVSATGFDLSGVAKTNAYISGGKWFKCLGTGPIEEAIDHEGAGFYLVVFDESIDLELNVSYMTLIKASNYGYQRQCQTSVVPPTG